MDVRFMEIRIWFLDSESFPLYSFPFGNWERKTKKENFGNSFLYLIYLEHWKNFMYSGSA